MIQRAVEIISIPLFGFIEEKLMRDYKVYYGIPTYSQFQHARESVLTILNTSSLIPDQIVIIDNSGNGSGVLALNDLTQLSNKIHVIPRTQNILSGAWNDIMNVFPDDYIIIANDDIKPHTYSIEALVNAAIEHPDSAMLNGSGHSGNSYSYFLLRKWAYARVGPFDIKFKPAYFEDNDYDYRLRILAGLIREEVPEATFDHVGSATLKAMTPEQQARHHMRFSENERYYLNKWGGLPGNERFMKEFEGIYDFIDD